LDSIVNYLWCVKGITMLYNANRCAIELKCGRRVGQLVFAEMDDHALNPYNGKYQGQTDATGSRVFMDSDKF